MATLTYLVILLLVQSSIQGSSDNKASDDSSGLYDTVISDILKEQTAENIGAKIQNLIQEDGGNILGEFISQFAKENAGTLLQGLGEAIVNQGKGKEAKAKTKEDDSSSADLLQGLGALAGAFQAAGGNGEGAGSLLQGLGSLMGGQGREAEGNGDVAGALLQGLGSLMAGQGQGAAGNGDTAGAVLQGLSSLMGGQGQGGEGGLNPALIGSLINAFAQNQDAPKKAKKSKSPKKDEAKKDDNLEFGDLLPLAAQLLGGQKQGKDSNLLNLLPMILQTINSFVGPEAQKREASHSDHAWSLPPYLERFHVLFDHFIHSEIGKYVIELLGAEKSFKVFTDESGRFSYKKFGELMENHSFRRHWIRQVTDRLAGMLQYMANPKVYKTYISSGQFFMNSYLKSLGFPKSAMLDPSKPVESISAFLNYIAKKYFDIKIKAKEYVKPAFKYLQELLKLAESAGSESSKNLSNTLADTINMEVIEPLARVNRAYRFAKTHPTCDRYVFCVVNENRDSNEIENIPGLKKLLHKAASMLASWFLSSHTGTDFFVLYTDITSDGNCKALYKDQCQDFHVEELKVTTEYVHNEL